MGSCVTREIGVEVDDNPYEDGNITSLQAEVAKLRNHFNSLQAFKKQEHERAMIFKTPKFENFSVSGSEDEYDKDEETKRNKTSRKNKKIKSEHLFALDWSEQVKNEVNKEIKEIKDHVANHEDNKSVRSEIYNSISSGLKHSKIGFSFKKPKIKDDEQERIIFDSSKGFDGTRGLKESQSQSSNNFSRKFNIRLFNLDKNRTEDQIDLDHNQNIYNSTDKMGSLITDKTQLNNHQTEPLEPESANISVNYNDDDEGNDSSLNDTKIKDNSTIRESYREERAEKINRVNQIYRSMSRSKVTSENNDESQVTNPNETVTSDMANNSMMKDFSGEMEANAFHSKSTKNIKVQLKDELYNENSKYIQNPSHNNSTTNVSVIKTVRNMKKKKPSDSKFKTVVFVDK